MSYEPEVTRVTVVDRQQLYYRKSIVFAPIHYHYHILLCAYTRAMTNRIPKGIRSRYSPGKETIRLLCIEALCTNAYHLMHNTTRVSSVWSIIPTPQLFSVLSENTGMFTPYWWRRGYVSILSTQTPLRTQLFALPWVLQYTPNSSLQESSSSEQQLRRVSHGLSVLSCLFVKASHDRRKFCSKCRKRQWRWIYLVYRDPVSCFLSLPSCHRLHFGQVSLRKQHQTFFLKLLWLAPCLGKKLLWQSVLLWVIWFVMGWLNGCENSTTALCSQNKVGPQLHRRTKIERTQ